MSRFSPWPAAFLLAASSLVFAASAADAPNLNVAKSSIIATFKQSGVAVDTPFTRFTGRIVYDAANVAAASASIEVETASLDIGDEEYNAEVRKKPWFDSATYPRATFRSTGIKASGPGKFIATGTLTVKGRVQTISVPIATKATPNGTAFEGSFAISRKAFGIGDPLWEEVLDDRVGVRFTLVKAGR
jgi:polyisoprenoid-binding protein YceI